jgi:hypothetical protein
VEAIAAAEAMLAETIDAADAAEGDAALGGADTYVSTGCRVDATRTDIELAGTAVPGIPVPDGMKGAEDTVILPYGTVGLPGFGGR